MNFFFGINNNIFKSKIQIPLFKNSVLKKTNFKLFKTYPKKNKWVLQEVINKKINDYFCILESNDISDNEIFFLADNTIFSEFDENELKNFNNFTDTSPPFRANFELHLNEGSFSSFQSEYPFSMISKKGTIFSSISAIANSDADKNYILFRNIIDKPIEQNFKAYLVNYKTKSIEDQFQIKTNYTNCIEISKRLIKPEIFFVTDKYLGIPMYVSVKENFLSFEHTHPPHEYILGKNRFLRVSNLRKEFNEIISKKIS